MVATNTRPGHGRSFAARISPERQSRKVNREKVSDTLAGCRSDHEGAV